MTIAKRVVKDYRIPVLTLALFVFMCFAREFFLTKANMFALVDSITAYGIAALGFTFVMLCGQLDISFGSVMALSSCVFMMVLPAIGFLPALVLALVLGSVCGAVTGFFIASFRLSAFIVSMTMQLIYKGVALTITNSTPVSLAHPALLAISRCKLFGIVPVVFFVFVLGAIGCEFLLRRTQYGRNLLLVGGNISVADNLGLPVRNYIWSAYVIQGLCAALGGVAMMTRMFSASGNLAIDGPLNIIPMVIVGGTIMAGGKGGTLKTLWGVLLMNIIYNAMSMFSIQVSIQQLVKGLILLIIIVSDKYVENKTAKV